MIKNLLDAAVAAIAYWAVGFAFAFGQGGNPFIGLSFCFLKGTNEYILWFFQYVFAGTTVTIDSFILLWRIGFGVLTAFYTEKSMTLLVEELFMDKNVIGIFYGGNGKQLGYNLYGMIVYFAWASGTCSILFWTLNYFGRFRVSEEVELMGMDIHHHGGHAYRMGSMVTSHLKEFSYSTEQMKADTAVAVKKEDEAAGDVVGQEILEENVVSKKEEAVVQKVDVEGGVVEKATEGGLRRRKRRLSSLPFGAV